MVGRVRSAWATAPIPTTPSWSGRSRPGRSTRAGSSSSRSSSDIQTLNEWALEGRLEVTALSAGAYPAVADRYLLLPHGASFGEGYGPIVVARGELSLDELRAVEIVTPGPLTTAKRVLQLALGDGDPHARPAVRPGARRGRRRAVRRRAC